jgi:hypothetical protein
MVYDKMNNNQYSKYKNVSSPSYKNTGTSLYKPATNLPKPLPVKNNSLQSMPKIQNTGQKQNINTFNAKPTYAQKTSGHLKSGISALPSKVNNIQSGFNSPSKTPVNTFNNKPFNNNMGLSNKPKPLNSFASRTPMAQPAKVGNTYSQNNTNLNKPTISKTAPLGRSSNFSMAQLPKSNFNRPINKPTLSQPAVSSSNSYSNRASSGQAYGAKPPIRPTRLQNSTFSQNNTMPQPPIRAGLNRTGSMLGNGNQKQNNISPNNLGNKFRPSNKW